MRMISTTQRSGRVHTIMRRRRQLANAEPRGCGDRDREILGWKVYPNNRQFYDRHFRMAYVIAAAIAEMNSKWLKGSSQKELAEIVGRHDDSVSGRGWRPVERFNPFNFVQRNSHGGPPHTLRRTLRVQWILATQQKSLTIKPMTTTHQPSPKVAAETPAVPLTTEGYSVLHQMMRFRRTAWRALAEAERKAIAQEASSVLAAMEQNSAGQSALYSLIGHKGDLMLVHFRETFADLNQAELKLANLRLSDYLEPTTSYLSIIELGLYDSTLKIYKELTDQDIEPKSNASSDATAKRCARACTPRFHPIATCASIPWTAAAAKTRTGTRSPSKSAPAR